jgi:polyisoprenoid-binding protein YceI
MRFHSRSLFITIILLLMLALAACSSASTPEAAPAEVVAVQPAAPTPAPAAEATKAPAVEALAAPADPAPEAASAAITFAIDPAQSEARFVIDEVLLGSPKTVVGVNSTVSGEVTVSPGEPGGVAIGPITIDANNFVTDSDKRNGAIQRFILQSSSYPAITFAPTAIEGVPGSVAVGDTLSLQVTGDLTIREITRAETFAIEVQVVSESELRINGETQIRRENYELTIPSVPSVANVTNEVQLQFDFVAVGK